MTMITRTWEWSPASTPPPAAMPGSVQVSTNGRGAVVWIPPGFVPRQASIPAEGQQRLSMRPPKLMMDPTDAATWQRPYRFT